MQNEEFSIILNKTSGHFYKKETTDNLQTTTKWFFWFWKIWGVLEEWTDKYRIFTPNFYWYFPISKLWEKEEAEKKVEISSKPASFYN